LLSAVFLYAPLAAASWSAHAMACCTGDRCPIAAHHHHPKTPASQNSHMDCEHDMGEVLNCSMSCCQSPDRPIVTAVAFVLPVVMSRLAPLSIVAQAETVRAIPISRFVKPLSPPPRLAHVL
jgi:hypothetical protein